MSDCDNNICRLCKLSIAGAKASHVVPKFITKALFDPSEKHAVLFQRDRNNRKVQDTFKIPYFLCDGCEKKFEVIETFIARKIQDIHNCKYLPEHFEYRVNGVNQWVECLSTKSEYFFLFFYSILWRISASNKLVEGFKTFAFDSKTEESIRLFLDSSLSVKAKEVKQKIKSIDIPSYYLFVFKPADRLYPPQSTLSAQSKDNIHILSLGEFFVMFYTREHDIPTGAKPYGNNSNQLFKIVLADIEKWRLLNKSFTKLEFVD